MSTVSDVTGSYEISKAGKEDMAAIVGNRQKNQACDNYRSGMNKMAFTYICNHCGYEYKRPPANANSLSRGRRKVYTKSCLQCRRLFSDEEAERIVKEFMEGK